MDTILLKGMIFYGYHGADKEENVLGQRFVIDVKMSLNLEKRVKRTPLGIPSIMRMYLPV